MNIIYLLLFSINLIVSFISYTMEKSLDDVWIKTKDKKVIRLTHEEACHSSYLSECKRLVFRNSSKKNPIAYDVIGHRILCKQLEFAIIARTISVHEIEKRSINITAQEIKFFKKILHQPSLFDQIKHKKYIYALTIAEKLKAPLLYAELLQAKLPYQALMLIIEKYKALSSIDSTINIAISKELLTSWKYAEYTFIQRSEQLEKAASNIKNLLNKITLPHAVILDMICDTTSPYRYPMHIIAHMPGYNTLKSWNKNNRNFFCKYFPINITETSTEKGNNIINSFNFTV